MYSYKKPWLWQWPTFIIFLFLPVYTTGIPLYITTTYLQQASFYGKFSILASGVRYLAAVLENLT